MTLQDIITQLQNIGGSQQYLGQVNTTSGISDIDEHNIASAMRNMYDLTAEQLPSEMFSAATISGPMLESTLQKTYAPQIEAQSQTLLSKLMESTSGKKMKKAGGGFAGSGQMQDYMRGAKDVYGKGMSGVLSNVAAQKSQGIQSINDIIKGWQTSAQQIAS